MLLKKLVRLGCITRGSLAEITNQRWSTDEGSSKLPKRLLFQRKPLVGDFRKRTLNTYRQTHGETGVQIICLTFRLSNYFHDVLVV